MKICSFQTIQLLLITVPAAFTFSIFASSQAQISSKPFDANEIFTVDSRDSSHVKIAKEKGKIPPGQFRVVVQESGKDSTKDFKSEKEAKQYADDAASETENGPVYSSVFDSSFKFIYRGKHY